MRSRPGSPTAPTTPTAGTCGSTTTTAAWSAAPPRTRRSTPPPRSGPILPGGAYGIATGTGSYFPGASDENTVKVYDTKCNQVWSDTLDGSTGGSPALADVQGNGQLAVVEGTVSGATSGTVYALNATTGAQIWSTNLGGAVVGSVTTADLTGSGAQDVIVATDRGLFVLDGPSGQMVAHVDDGSGNGGVQPAGAISGSRTHRW